MIATAQHDLSVITSLYLSKKENCIQTEESEAEREMHISRSPRPRERSRMIRLETSLLHNEDSKQLALLLK